MKYIDLHVHSNASDGSLSPSDVVDHAVKSGLAAFALTDHDTIRGIAEAKERAAWHRSQGHAIEVCSGVEISAAYKERDIHILGLLIQESDEHLIHALNEALENRERRNERMMTRFDELLHITITLEELTDGVPDTVITRAHFARVLQKKGIVSTTKEAFEKYLNPNAPCYVPRGYIEPEQAISLIRAAHGVPVLAHPLLYNLNANELFSLLERLTAAGLQGLEVFYSANHGQDETNLRALASHFSLVMSGGSDFHGAAKPQIALGNLKIPYSVLERIKTKLPASSSH